MRMLITIVMVLLVGQLYAAEFKVSTVDEFNSALQKVAAGDCIVWKKGTYADVKLNFKPAAKGVAGKCITLKAEMPGEVIFTGSSQIGISGEYLAVNGFLYKGASTLKEGENVISYTDLYKADHKTRFSRVTNCAIIDYTVANDQTENKWVIFYGTNNEFDNSTLIGKKNQGATLVVNYYRAKDYVDGSEVAPSTYHSIHHNYFGYRTMPNDNGGEHLRIGDSKTSFTRGFNVVEYNYFTQHLEEPEVISNKSCDNIYRFNTFIENEGALVLRHGNRCLVYGNYINGKNSNSSGGIRVIGDHHFVFNNYLENLNGAKEKLKAPITIMAGVVGTALNGYYPADSSVIAFNTVVNSAGPVFRIGAGNKGKEYNSPKGLVLVQNVVIKPSGNMNTAAIEDMSISYARSSDNFFIGGANPGVRGFTSAKPTELAERNAMQYVKRQQADAEVVQMILAKLAAHDIKADEKTLTQFNPKWILEPTEVGALWMRKQQQ